MLHVYHVYGHLTGGGGGLCYVDNMEIYNGLSK